MIKYIVSIIKNIVFKLLINITINHFISIFRIVSLFTKTYTDEKIIL